MLQKCAIEHGKVKVKAEGVNSPIILLHTFSVGDCGCLTMITSPLDKLVLYVVTTTCPSFNVGSMEDSSKIQMSKRYCWKVYPIQPKSRDFLKISLLCLKISCNIGFFVDTLF